MSNSTKIIVIGIIAVAGFLAFKHITKNSDVPTPARVVNSPTVMTKKDSSGITIAAFAKNNFIHHFRQSGDESWCQVIGSPELFIMKNMTPQFEEQVVSPLDKQNGVDFLVMVTIEAQAHKVKRPAQEWTGWKPGKPSELRGYLFFIQRINGRYLWVPNVQITPI